MSPAPPAGLCDVNGYGADAAQTLRAADSPNDVRNKCDVYVDVPTACATNAACPLVFFFHGTADNYTVFIGPPFKTPAGPEVATTAIHADGNMIGIYVQGVSHGLNPGWNCTHEGPRRLSSPCAHML